MVNTLKIGEETEAAALQFLLRQGLSLITRNYRCQYGEIDLIMQDITSVVFIEVRYRRHAEFGGSANSITTQKKNQEYRTSFFATSSNRCR